MQERRNKKNYGVAFPPHFSLFLIIPIRLPLPSPSINFCAFPSLLEWSFISPKIPRLPLITRSFFLQRVELPSKISNPTTASISSLPIGAKGLYFTYWLYSLLQLEIAIPPHDCLHQSTHAKVIFMEVYSPQSESKGCSCWFQHAPWM